MKMPEELNALKEEGEALNKKLHELTKEELEQVAGGVSSLRPHPVIIVEQPSGETLGAGGDSVGIIPAYPAYP